MSLPQIAGEITERLLKARLATFLFLPFVPGGIVALGGFIIAKARGIDPPLIPPIFGGITPAIICLFVTYVIGMILVYVVTALSYLAAYLLGRGLARAVGGRSLTKDPSLNATWRALATQFLGPSLAPPIDSAWKWWFRTLDAYFPRRYDPVPPGFQFSGCVQASGWALIMVMFSAPWSHWLPWTIALVAAVGGFMLDVVSGFTYAGSEDSLFHRQVADMLREVTRRSAESPAISRNDSATTSD